MEVVNINVEIFEATQCRLEALVAKDLAAWEAFSTGRVDGLSTGQVAFAARAAQRLQEIASDLAVLRLEGILTTEE
jgi:hypothetical protein